MHNMNVQSVFLFYILEQQPIWFFFILLYCDTKELFHIFSFLLNFMVFFIFIFQSYYFYMHMDVNPPPIDSPTHPCPEREKEGRVETWAR